MDAAVASSATQEALGNTRFMRFVVTSTAPLVLERFQGFEKIEGDQTSVDIHVHRNLDGQINLPTTSFRWAILNACNGRKIGRMGAMTVVKAAVFSTERRCLLVDPVTDAPVTEFAIHERVIVTGRGKNKVEETKRNPRIDNWKCFVDFEVDLDFLPDTNTLLSLFKGAGKISGIGVGCPRYNGEFGTFNVDLVGLVD